MKFSILGRKVEVTENFRAKIEKKIGKLNKFFQDDASVHVVLSSEKGKQKAEVTVNSLGMIYRAQESTEDFMISVDVVVDTLERQIRKNKTRLEKKIKAGAGEKMPEFFGSDADELEDEFDIIKVKKFSLKPMGVDEAILQMNMLSHQFFVFLDMETETTCVVYKRYDGGYGLIEPQ